MLAEPASRGPAWLTRVASSLDAAGILSPRSGQRFRRSVALVGRPEQRRIGIVARPINGFRRSADFLVVDLIGTTAAADVGGILLLHGVRKLLRRTGIDPFTFHQRVLFHPSVLPEQP